MLRYEQARTHTTSASTGIFTAAMNPERSAYAVHASRPPRMPSGTDDDREQRGTQTAPDDSGEPERLRPSAQGREVVAAAHRRDEHLHECRRASSASTPAEQQRETIDARSPQDPRLGAHSYSSGRYLRASCNHVGERGRHRLPGREPCIDTVGRDDVAPGLDPERRERRSQRINARRWVARCQHRRQHDLPNHRCRHRTGRVLGAHLDPVADAHVELLHRARPARSRVRRAARDRRRSAGARGRPAPPSMADRDTRPRPCPRGRRRSPHRQCRHRDAWLRRPSGAIRAVTRVAVSGGDDPPRQPSAPALA